MASQLSAELASIRALVIHASAEAEEAAGRLIKAEEKAAALEKQNGALRGEIERLRLEKRSERK